MKYIVVIIDMDDVDPIYALGPYDDVDQAERDGIAMVDYLSDETLPGHVRPHEWSWFIQRQMTYNEAILERQG